jgi:hypothetical protein
MTIPPCTVGKHSTVDGTLSINLKIAPIDSTLSATTATLPSKSRSFSFTSEPRNDMNDLATVETYEPKSKVTAQEKGLHTESMCDLFRSSVRSFQLLLLQTETLSSPVLTTSLVPQVKDEFSRLRIWGEQTYAVLPQNSRRSLDAQLREDEDTKKIVVRSLRRLNNHIEKGCVTNYTVS